VNSAAPALALAGARPVCISRRSPTLLCQFDETIVTNYIAENKRIFLSSLTFAHANMSKSDGKVRPLAELGFNNQPGAVAR
jgi:hypothetical protein